MERTTMKKQLAISAAPTLVSSAAGVTTVEAQDFTGWYGGVNLGSSNLNLNGGDVDSAFANQGITTSSSIDRHDAGYSLNLGYLVNPHFAVEGGYVDFGKFNFHSVASAQAADTINGNYKAHGYNLSAVGIVPLQRGLSVYGKAGAFRSLAELDASSTGLVPVSGANDWETHPTFCIGAGYDFSKNIVGKLEWNCYLNVGDGSTTGRSDIDLYMAGMGYKF
jgi:OmpA-OmpF porin, OOP family